MNDTIETKLENIIQRLKKLPSNAHTERMLLISEALELDRILQAQKIMNVEILDFFLEAGLITIKEKEKISFKWDNIKPDMLKELDKT